jgi:hypothetical protein
VAAAVALAAAALAACTSHPDRRTPPSSAPASAPLSSAPPPSSPAPEAAVTHAPPDATSVIAEKSAAMTSVRMSQLLFASAPTAVLTSSDATSLTQAASSAQRLGVPVLISDGAAAGAAVADEVRRLGCARVLVVGAAAQVDGVPVVSDDSQLTVRPPKPLENAAVLVPTGDDPGVVAASATARAAAAAVIAVHGDDPRADPAVIEALSESRPKHVVAVGAGFGSARTLASRVATASTGAQLPGGGQRIFPGHRFVALYGHPGTASLGVLGAQDLDDSIDRARQLAARYDPLSDVPVIPTFEIIATVAQGAAGKDGDYSGESSVDSLRPWVETATAAGLYVVLDLQPGRADPLAQAKMYAPLLALPNVGLAVDPEWALGPNQLPLKQIGTIDSSKLNAVGGWLDAFTASKHLPQKLFVLHQFRLSMIGNEAKLRTGYDNLALLIHMDGQGTQPNKEATWRSVVAAAPKGVPFGWKNFTKEDHPMLDPTQTMARNPKPMMISYQ